MTRIFGGAQVQRGFIAFFCAILQSRGKRQRSGVHIVATSALLVVVVAITFGINIWSARTNLLNDAEEDSQLLTSLAESQVASALGTTSLVLAAVQDSARRGSAALQSRFGEIDALQEERRRLLPLESDVLVIDSLGNTIMETGGRIRAPAGMSDRDFFRHHRDNRSNADFVGKPFLSTRTGHMAFTLSRRIEDAAGRFNGVVVASIDIPWLEATFGRLKSHYGGGFLLARNDGIVLARGPHVDGVVGKSMKDTPLFNRHLRESPAGSYRKARFADNVEPIFGYSTLANFPLVVSVGLNQADVLGTWYCQKTAYALMAAALMTVLV